MGIQKPGLRPVTQERPLGIQSRTQQARKRVAWSHRYGLSREGITPINRDYLATRRSFDTPIDFPNALIRAS